jgi:D-glycero-alpha-D-manno-heptose 1-phosphate guanylyltransferase
MEAIVLAGGLGTRLRTAVPDLPKPMAPVAGRPFLAWILDQLADAGFYRAVLAVGYRHEVIRAHFGSGYRGVELFYSVEKAPLGTGGAMRLALEQVDESPVFVLNGDTYLEADYAGLLAAHVARGVALSMAVTRVADVSRYGSLQIENDRICGFLEKGSHGPGYINAGIYLIDTEVLAGIPVDTPYSFEQDLMVPGVETLRPLAFQADGLFIDIGVPEDYERAQGLFGARLERRPRA